MSVNQKGHIRLGNILHLCVNPKHKGLHKISDECHMPQWLKDRIREEERQEMSKDTPN